MKFFLDNNIPPQIAKALNALSEPEGHPVSHLTDRFDGATPDAVWIAQLAEEGGWVVVSGDRRIRTNPVNRIVWREAKLTGFFLKKGWKDHKIWCAPAV